MQTNENGHPIAMGFTRLKGFRKEEIARWTQLHLAASSLVVSDGLACFGGVEEAGCQHEPIVTGGSPGSVMMQAFTWINTMIGNAISAMHGSYHAISEAHLPRYLAEFCHRFNCRFKLEDMTPHLGYAAVRTPPMPQRLLNMVEAWG